MKTKTILLSAIILLLFSCTAKKEYVILQEDTTVPDTCPKEGSCDIKVHTDKTIVVKTSELGELYYELQDSKDKTVIVYTYTKTVRKDIMDAGYREEIVFEINNDAKSSVISDANLQQAKMLFGRFCFCKGSTGYYRIKSGSLKTDSDKGIKRFDLDFHIDEVPQVLQRINFSIK